MKHSLEFNLPEDQFELDLHNNLSRYIRTIFEIREVIAKYRNDGAFSSEILDHVLNELCEKIPEDLPL
jgi:hypothetical protein